MATNLKLGRKEKSRGKKNKITLDSNLKLGGKITCWKKNITVGTRVWTLATTQYRTKDSPIIFPATSEGIGHNHQPTMAIAFGLSFLPHTLLTF